MKTGKPKAREESPTKAAWAQGTTNHQTLLTTTHVTYFSFYNFKLGYSFILKKTF